MIHPRPDLRASGALDGPGVHPKMIARGVDDGFHILFGDVAPEDFEGGRFLCALEASLPPNAKLLGHQEAKRKMKI